ncbi:MAG TPA: L,D-transpeptidase [Nitrospiraceae bacterium]|nr:L,D-transpeptidase [Nitrospiraceae bacterium]
MRRPFRHLLHSASGLLLLCLSTGLTGCIETVPDELVDAVEAVDRDLVSLRAADISPEDYSRFVQHWIALKSQVQSEENLVRWPWEENGLESALEKLHEEGTALVAAVKERQHNQRLAAEAKLSRIEQKMRFMTASVGTIGSRLVPGEQHVETELWIKHARALLEDGQFERSIQASDRASKILLAQATTLNHELGRYADEEVISAWKDAVRRTVEWSQAHRAQAIVISKADRLLILYRNGRKVLTYPIQLGSRGIRAKRHYGDGATPEGEYRIVRKRGQRHTPFYRSLILDYPNADDKRRFEAAQKAGEISSSHTMAGSIEIHGIAQGITDQPFGSIVLDNRHIADLFQRVGIGTPVTIVGALESQNSVSLVLADLGDQEEET